ncbi:hypothetical protein ACX27_05685 [Nostoc piscinale CENA21]|uniref:DUF6888 domain-containing protein n=1 Tax=Nostoc piscinale CENA21 TaxID=224013 RepID=A0A0M4T244_9NOSO|nr:hypothetical protein [Nostoc piscinale]ALF52454.1 hypothetical protein ACX27_05685 [Nostoc piscinale CENA21]
MEPTNAQTQALYRICYRLTKIYKSIELVRLDERTGNLYVLAGENIEFEIEPSGYYKSSEDKA